MKGSVALGHSAKRLTIVNNGSRREVSGDNYAVSGEVNRLNRIYPYFTDKMQTVSGFILSSCGKSICYFTLAFRVRALPKSPGEKQAEPG